MSDPFQGLREASGGVASAGTADPFQGLRPDQTPTDPFAALRPPAQGLPSVQPETLSATTGEPFTGLSSGTTVKAPLATRILKGAAHMIVQMAEDVNNATVAHLGAVVMGRGEEVQQKIATDPAYKESVQRGTANMASMLPGMAWGGKALAVGEQVISRAGLKAAGRFLAVEAAGGAVYGAVEPAKDAGERAQHIAVNAALFPVFGVGIAAVGIPVKAGLAKLAEPIQRKIAQRATVLAKQATAAVEHPSEEVAQTLHGSAIEQAYHDYIGDPHAISGEQASATPAQMALETRPRGFNATEAGGTAAAEPQVTGLQGPREVTGLPDHTPTAAELGAIHDQLMASVESVPVSGLLDPEMKAQREALMQQAADLAVAREIRAAQEAAVAPKQGPITAEQAAQRALKAQQAALDNLPANKALTTAPLDPGLEAIGGDFGALLDKALAQEGSAAESGVELFLTDQPPIVAPNDLGAAVQPKMRKQVRQTLEQAMQRPITLDAADMVSRGTLRPSVTPSGPMGLDTWGLVARMSREQRALLASKAGAVSRRTLLGITGAGLYGVGSEGDNLNPAVRAGLKTVGAFLAVGAVGSSPAFRAWIEESGFVRKTLEALNPDMFFKGEAANALAAVRGDVTSGQWMAATMRRRIMEAFPDKQMRESVLPFVLDEGLSAPEAIHLSPDQMALVGDIKALHEQMGQIGQAEGILTAFRENYFRRIWPKESEELLPRMTGKGSLGPGGFAKAREFPTLRSALQYAAEKGIPGPRMDAENVIGIHIEEWHRAVANARIQREMTNLGLISDLKGSAGVNDLTHPLSVQTILDQTPKGWRGVKVIGLEGKVAPSEVAAALEHLARTDTPHNVAVRAMDTLKSYWMRSIMFWFWEHGVNVARGVLTLDGTVPGYMKAMKALDQAAPLRHEAASHGFLDPFEASRHGAAMAGKTDFAPASKEASQVFEGILAKAGPLAPTLDKIRLAGGHFMEWNDRLLWEKMVPAIGLQAYATEMRRATESALKAGTDFTYGSPAYELAGRRAATFANTMMGAAPRYIKDPRVATTLRNVLLSPAWLETRLKLSANAAVEGSRVLTGDMALRDATYLQVKARMALWGIAITTAGSLAMTGKPPVFNPKTEKFYMQTPATTARGNTMGVDLLGWWQDDLKSSDDPMMFLAGRLSPPLAEGIRQVTGRNYRGEQMAGSERVGSLVQSFGVPADAAKLALHEATGQQMSSGEMVQGVSNIAAFGNAATLPRPMDAAVGMMAERLLRTHHIPVTDDRATEIGRLIRGNILTNQPAVDGQVIRALTYMEQGTARSHPALWLWNRSRDFLKSLPN